MAQPTAQGRLSIVVAALMGVVLATEAHAQMDSRSTAPIDITANEAEVVSAKCLAIWRGEAEALQGQARLRANTISVYSQIKGKGADGRQECGGTDRIEADGQVFYVTPQQNARGDHAVYTQSADQIVITGNVIVVQGEDVARGDRLTIKVSTRQATLESSVVGPGKAGRVRGVFFPSKTAGDGKAAAP